MGQLGRSEVAREFGVIRVLISDKRNWRNMTKGIDAACGMVNQGRRQQPAAKFS